MCAFRVDVDAYNGPLDLLLFLIRKEEVDIYDIPVARITSQYIAYVRLIEAIDPNLAGDFLVMAATLMEIKSRTLLPRAPVDEEEDDTFVDPRTELLQQLLQYKTFKDAALQLGAAAQWQALRFARQPATTEPEQAEQRFDLEDVQVWDLLDAFGRLLQATGRRAETHDVVYDDTPIALHAADLIDSLSRAGGSQRFEEIFAGRNKSELIGLFLALLELVRKRRVRAEQDGVFSTITIHLLDDTPIQTDEYDDGKEELEAQGTGHKAQDEGWPTDSAVGDANSNDEAQGTGHKAQVQEDSPTASEVPDVGTNDEAARQQGNEAIDGDGWATASAVGDTNPPPVAPTDPTPSPSSEPTNPNTDTQPEPIDDDQQ